jgi:4-hydroxy-tetrahydrodipicolinate synthase
MALHEALFIETNPAPVKLAAKLLGLCSDDLRLPLAPVGAATAARVEAALRSAGLLN